MSEIVAFPTPQRRTMAEKALAASRTNRTATRDIGKADDRRAWASEKFDDALRVFRAIFGTAALLTRLQEAIAAERQLHQMDEVKGDG